MTCREFVEFLMEYLSHELQPSQRAAFEEHLAGCRACVAYLSTYQETIRLGKLAYRGEDMVPEEVPEELVQAILHARKRLT